MQANSLAAWQECLRKESARSHVCDEQVCTQVSWGLGFEPPSANRLGKWHGPARPMGIMSRQPPRNVLTTLALAPSPLTLPEHWRADRKHRRNQTNSEIHKRTDRVTRELLDGCACEQTEICTLQRNVPNAHTLARTLSYGWSFEKERERETERDVGTWIGEDI